MPVLPVSITCLLEGGGGGWGVEGGGGNIWNGGGSNINYCKSVDDPIPTLPVELGKNPGNF